ncbi:MAG: hypothetical protein GYA56_10880 [Geobacteraceae bacterium]|jgi:hypothetical protein|nr:hypothetical protein [Geobacteraceae bacterium]
MRLGKKIERNLVRSMKMGGIPVFTSPVLDHNYKIDFAFCLPTTGMVGVQVGLWASEEDSAYKAVRSKTCAERVLDRFVFLRLSPGYFLRIDPDKGKRLFRLLVNSLSQSREKTIMIHLRNHWVSFVTPI